MLTAVSIAGVGGMTALDTAINALLHMFMMTSRTTAFLVCGAKDTTLDEVAHIDATSRVAIIEAFIEEEHKTLSAHSSTQLAVHSLRNIIDKVQNLRMCIDRRSQARSHHLFGYWCTTGCSGDVFKLKDLCDAMDSRFLQVLELVKTLKSH